MSVINDDRTEASAVIKPGVRIRDPDGNERSDVDRDQERLPVSHVPGSAAIKHELLGLGHGPRRFRRGLDLGEAPRCSRRETYDPHRLPRHELGGCRLDETRSVNRLFEG